jgi:hypothetical protein
MRKIVLLAVLASFAGLPALKALADEGGYARTPAAADSTAKKKKKKKSKKKASSKKHASSKKKAHGTKHASKGKTHAPKAAAAEPMPSAPQYPTQPGAAGGFSDIPNEKKDDLPPPAPQPN